MADTFADKYKLKSSRLKNYDYSSSGIYFITICTLNHNNFFGKIINQQMELSKMGIIVNQCLIDTPKHFKKITLDEYIVMPNHVHLLLNLKPTSFNPVETHHDASLTKRYNNYFQRRDVACNVSTNNTNVSTIQKNISTENKTSNYFSNISPKPNSIPTIIRSFKSAVTHQINPKTIFFAWQPRYHDIIIKDKTQYFTTKNYIQNNVINWEKDKYFLKNKK